MTGYDGSSSFNKATIRNIKRIDCAQLPPCAKVLQKKIERSNYVEILWANADKCNTAENMDPKQYGWLENDVSYTPDWYEGSSIPNYIQDFNDYVSIHSDEAEDEIWSDDSDLEDICL